MTDDEQHQTTAYAGDGYALYLRRNLHQPVWYVRFKPRDGNRTIRRSTGCTDLENAKQEAARIVASLEIPAKPGQGHPSDCPCFSCWRLRFT